MVPLIRLSFPFSAKMRQDLCFSRQKCPLAGSCILSVLAHESFPLFDIATYTIVATGQQLAPVFQTLDGNTP